MKAVTVVPRQPGSATLSDLPHPELTDKAGDRGVLVPVPRVGLDGTDSEIVAGQYGDPPPDSDVLVLGHEGFGVFEQVGSAVHELMLVLDSVTGDRTAEIPSDAINLSFVLGNKALARWVNAAWEHFEAGVRDLAVASVNHPGWAPRLLTHPVQALERHADALPLPGSPGASKVYVEVALEDES